MSTCVYLHYGTTGCIKPPTFDKMRMSDEVKRQLESGFGDLRKVLETIQTNVEIIRVSEKFLSSYVLQL
jgi:hypothetical protein